ncbi:MAG: hypothetical protein WBA77_17825 [Microcoleaceae cyanobacterium]
MTLSTIFQATFFSDISPQLQNSVPLQSLIQKEINQTKIRFNPIINTWILASVLIPTSATLSVLVLMFKYGRKVKALSNDIEAKQPVAVSQFKERMSETQVLFSSIQSEIQTSKDNIKKIDDKIKSYSEEKGVE